MLGALLDENEIVMLDVI